MTPRLSIGLPVYNGEEYLARSLDSILGQGFGDFELLISSNASTDGTDDICRAYVRQDRRVRFIRQPRNLGAVGNDTFVLDAARCELFKWASDDDLWAGTLLERCIALLDAHPDAVLAHAWTAAIDARDELLQALEYPLATDAAQPSERFRSMLFDGDDLPGAIRSDDFYGVIRTDAVRRVRPHDSYYHADHVFMAELALHGRFVQDPDWLYFRRHHAGRAAVEHPTVRGWCSSLDPRRADPWRHPTARLVAEYPLGYLRAIRHAPIPAAEKARCMRHLTTWVASRVRRRLASTELVPIPDPPAGLDVRSRVPVAPRAVAE